MAFAAGNKGLFGGLLRFGLTATTHVDGRFTIENVPSIPLKMRVFSQGSLGGRDPGAVIGGPEVTPTAGETTTVEVGGPARDTVG